MNQVKKIINQLFAIILFVKIEKNASYKLLNNYSLGYKLVKPCYKDLINNDKKSYLICKMLYNDYACRLNDSHNLRDNHNFEHGLKLSKKHCHHKILDRCQHTFDSCTLCLLDSRYLEYILVGMK